MLMASTPFGVSAGHFTLFRVVSRSPIQRFRRSPRLLQRVRFPAAPPLKALVRSTFLAGAFFTDIHIDKSAVSAAAMASRQVVPAKTAPEYTQVLYRLNGKQASKAFDVPAHAIEFRRMVEQLGAVQGA